MVVAVDVWARELARSTLSDSTPTLFCTPDGQCTPAVELRPSRDLVSDPSGHPSVGRPESAALCSFSGTVLLLQNHYPRFRGAPSGHFRMLTKRPPSVDSGLATTRLGKCQLWA